MSPTQALSMLPTQAPTILPTQAPTMSPTQAPTLDSLLGVIKSFSGDLLDDPNSPQYQASQWMKTNPTADDPETYPARIQQRYALITLYTALLGDIPPFVSEDECYWTTITCGTNNTSSIFEAKDWQVTEIKMGRQFLTGSIPSEIKLLSSSLVYLDLAENPYLYGNIPEQLYELTNLKYLYLHDSALTGTLSESVGNLQLLEDLYLGNNEFTGTIPYNLGSRQGIRPLRKSK